MAKQGKEKRPTKAPLVSDVPVAESSLSEDTPTKQPIVHDESVAESILTKGLPVKKPLSPSAETAPEEAPE